LGPWGTGVGIPFAFAVSPSLNYGDRLTAATNVNRCGEAFFGCHRPGKAEKSESLKKVKLNKRLERLTTPSIGGFPITISARQIEYLQSPTAWAVQKQKAVAVAFCSSWDQLDVYDKSVCHALYFIA